MKTRHAIALAATVPAFGASLFLGLATVHADDMECVDSAPRVCLPGNPEGKPAACYDDGGVIVALWPCKPWAPADGWRHGDGTITYP
jgi:hypothetical protein